MEWKVKTKSDSPGKVKAIGGKERFKALYICYMHSRHCYKALNDAFGLAWSEKTIDSSLEHELEYGSNWKNGKQGQKFVTVAYSECRVSVMLNGIEITGRNGRASSADI